jgi:hypothetical protein
MKRCTKCDLRKELNEFYKSNSTEDGFHNSCKECWKKRRNERYIETRDKVRRKCREYYILHAEYLKEKSRKNKKTSEQTQKWRANHPEKYKAHYAVSNALKRGLISKKESCEICNLKTKLHAHHKDYTEPLKVLWVCKDCHAKIHIKEI